MALFADALRRSSPLSAKETRGQCSKRLRRVSSISFSAITRSGGARVSLDKTRAWYERLYRLLPDIRFDVRRIRISGPPWNTLVTVDWIETNSGTDGVRTFTPGAHVAKLVWGKLAYIGIYPDTVGLVSTLERLARAGVTEATAPKIEG